MEKEMHMTTANDRTIAARVSLTEYDRLAALAEKLTTDTGRTVRRSDLIRQAVVEFIERHNTQTTPDEVGRLIRIVHGG